MNTRALRFGVPVIVDMPLYGFTKPMDSGREACVKQRYSI